MRRLWNLIRHRHDLIIELEGLFSQRVVVMEKGIVIFTGRIHALHRRMEYLEDFVDLTVVSEPVLKQTIVHGSDLD